MNLDEVLGDGVFSGGDVVRVLQIMDRRIRQLETGRRLEHASIGAGGLRVIDGFIVILDANGNEQMRLSTEGLTLEGLLRVIGRIVVESEDGIEVLGGGSVDVNDGGAIRARYPDGSTAIVYGSLVLEGTDIQDGHGLLVQDNQAGGLQDIFRAKREPDGDKAVFIGASESDIANPIDEFTTRSLFTLLDTYVDDSTNIADPQTRISQATSINLQSGNQINLRTPDDPSVRVDAASTGNSPNAVILSPNGTIAVNTSARRFKTAIENYQVDTDAVLQLQPRTWRDKRDVELDPDTEAWHVGLVAEEVDALGLHEYVDYDADGKPQRVTYDRLCIALLQLVQSQEERLVALEAAVGAATPKRVRQATRKPKRRPVDDGTDDSIKGKAGR